MEAGSLNRRIQIQTRDAGEDALGQPVLTWTTTATVWADVRGATGMGYIKSTAEGVANESNAYSFRIRYLPGLDAGMRIVYGGENYDVKTVRYDVSGKRWTDLVAVLGGNDG